MWHIKSKWSKLRLDSEYKLKRPMTLCQTFKLQFQVQILHDMFDNVNVCILNMCKLVHSTANFGSFFHCKSSWQRPATKMAKTPSIFVLIEDSHSLELWSRHAIPKTYNVDPSEKSEGRLSQICNTLPFFTVALYVRVVLSRHHSKSTVVGYFYAR